MKREKKQKQPYVDDGHTIYNMDGVGRDRVKRDNEVDLTRRERFAAIRAALETYLVPFVIALLGFGATAVLLYFWLK